MAYLQKNEALSTGGRGAGGGKEGGCHPDPKIRGSRGRSSSCSFFGPSGLGFV